MKNAVIVKSFRNGLTLYLDSDLDFGQLLEEVVRQLLRRSTLKANRVKRQKVGRVVAVLPLTRLSV